MKLLEHLTHNTNKVINDSEFKNSVKKNTNDFTRTRKMNFETAILFMLTRFKCSTQNALRKFFNTQNNDDTPIKQQSFSETRTKIKPEAFLTLFKVSADTMLTHCKKKWHNYYRLFAIDGSKIDLPQDRALKGYFGTNGRNATSACAQGLLLYDVLNDIIVDAIIAPLNCDERTLAMAHLDNCKAQIPEEKKLLIFDRGYASFELITKLETDGFYYVMRVRKKFNKDIDAQTNSDDAYVLLEKGLEIEGVKFRKAIGVRVLKFLLDSGEEETLLTNLFDGGLGVGDFKVLYFMRWPIETKYSIAKRKLQVENFTARSVDGVLQDFYATMYLVNAVACAGYDVQAEIEAERADKDNKYRYKANVNELIGVLKDRLILALTKEPSEEQALLIEGLLKEIASSVVPVRENRLVPRNSFPRKVKFHHNRKVNC
jgi:hypothetical protein